MFLLLPGERDARQPVGRGRCPLLLPGGRGLGPAGKPSPVRHSEPGQSRTTIRRTCRSSWFPLWSPVHTLLESSKCQTVKIRLVRLVFFLFVLLFFSTTSVRRQHEEEGERKRETAAIGRVQVTLGDEVINLQDETISSRCEVGGKAQRCRPLWSPSLVLITSSD